MRALKNSLFAATIAAMGLAGCGGDGGSTGTVNPGGGTVTTTTYAGVAVDGYLQGAKVCFDTNANLACDSGEASATTDASGKYSLQVAAGASGNIVVEVGADAIDSDTGKAVGKPYVMVTPVGHHQVVSPLTTLVQLRTLDGVPLDEAIEDIKQRTGISDLMRDYVADKDEHAHAVARIAALAMATKLETIKTLDPALPVKTAVRIAGGEIDPAEISLAAGDAAYRTDGKLDLDKVAASTLAKLSADAAEVKTMSDEATVADRFAGAAAVSAQTVLVDGHVNYLYLDDRGLLKADRNRIDESGAFRNHQDHTWIAGAWVPPTKSGSNNWQRILLDRAAESWTAVEGEWKAGVEADGSATLTRFWNGEPVKLSYSALDLSGKKIADWLPASMLSQAKLRLRNPDALFPDGAKALAAKWVQSDAGYVLYSSTGYKNFDEILGKTGGDKGLLSVYLGSRMVKARFAGEGKVEFFAYEDPTVSLGSGSWAFETVAGQQILVLNGPTRLMTGGATLVNRIFALYKNEIYDGVKGPKETQYQTEQIYNDAALAALATELERDVPPNAGTVRIHFSKGTVPDSDFGVWAFNGWAEDYPKNWPGDRQRFTVQDSWGVTGDYAVATGAGEVKFLVLGTNGIKSCNGDLGYTLPANFAQTRFAEIWVEGCRVSESSFKRTVAYVEVFYKSPTNLTDPDDTDWGIWTWEGTSVTTSSPEGASWPVGRITFDFSYSSQAGPAWISTAIPLLEGQTAGKMAFQVVDKNGVKSCGDNLGFDFAANPPAPNSTYNGLPVWKISVDGCAVTNGAGAGVF